jgi:predicted O-methyltransferase YrrM
MAEAPPVEAAPFWRQFPVRAALAALPYVPRIPAARLEALFPGIGELEISIRHETRDRALNHGEAFALSLIAAFVQPRRIFEIGTASGQATWLMGRQAQQAQIDTMDLGNHAPSLGQQRGQPPWQDLSQIGIAFRGTEVEPRVTQHFADSAQFDYGPFRGAIDLMLIDGGHTYEYVKHDSSAALELMRPGGVIVWDDCNYISPGVSKALHELRAGGTPVYRVIGTRLAVARLPA